MKLRKSDLDEIGNPDAPKGSRQWTIAVARFIRSIYDDVSARVVTVQGSLAGLKACEGWKSVSQRDGTAFVSFEHYCQTPWHDGGLGIEVATVEQILSNSDPGMKVGALGKPGEFGRGRPKEDRVYNVNSKGGNRPEYLTARLARDNPEILAQLKAGDFPSVRQAAIAAGIVKIPTPLELAKRAVKRMAVMDQNRFFSWLKEEYGM